MAKKILVISALLFLMSCKNDESPRLEILAVLQDFSFVGSGQANWVSGDNNELDTAYVAPHGLDSIALPNKLNWMTQYVFHYKNGKDNRYLALEEFPLRLSSVGCKILEAPTAQGGFSYPSFAGPLFKIKFSYGKHVGYLYNQVDGRLNNSNIYKNEDYIIVFIK